MKRLVLLIGLFVVVQGFVPAAKCAVDITSMAEEMKIMETVAGATASKAGKVRDANAIVPDRSIEGIRDINVTEADANTAVEPNEEDPHAKMLEDIEKAFENIKRGGQREERGWIQLKAEEKTDLIKAVRDQVLNELNVLREIAIEEEAVKTTAAIDKLLADREERFEKVLKRMEAEEEKMQRKEQLRSKRGRERDRDRDKERRQRKRD